MHGRLQSLNLKCWQACYHCVRSLAVDSRKRLRGRWFCSDACASTAIAEYLPVRPCPGLLTVLC